MGNIIYNSSISIPWETQGAFKMREYHVNREDDMVYCYLKAYVRNGSLILNSFQFIEDPEGNDSMTALINIPFGKTHARLLITYGYEGISRVEGGCAASDIIFNSYKSDDEQGFYWCGEINIPETVIEQISNTKLAENMSIGLNLRQNFEDGGYAVLFDEDGRAFEDVAGEFILMAF
jgi:hypothetical protein